MKNFFKNILKRKETFSEGKSGAEVIRIGKHIHKSSNSNTGYTNSLLMLLEKKNYKYSPRFKGIDKEGRSIYTYFEGEMARGERVWKDKQLILITKMIREFHNATEGSKLAKGKEVVCHIDLAPWNLVIKKNEPVGFIDFDGSKPGYRIEDFAYFLWTFLELSSEKYLVKEQVKRIKLLTDEYQEIEKEKLVDAIINQQERILNKRIDTAKNGKTEKEREFSEYKIPIIEKEIDWVKENREEIEKVLFDKPY